MNKLLKSILSLVLCMGCVFALTACGQQNSTTTDNTDTAVSNNTVAENNTDDSVASTPRRKHNRRFKYLGSLFFVVGQHTAGCELDFR